MRRTIFLIIAIFFSLAAIGQDATLNNFTGVVQYSGATTSGVVKGEYVVTMGSFVDQTNQFFANDMQPLDIAWDNAGRRWRVDTILTSNLTSATVEVTSLTPGAGGPFGVGFVSREINGLSGMPPDNSTGISQQLKSRVETHNNMVIAARLPVGSESSRTLYVRDGATGTPVIGDPNSPFPHPWAAADTAMAGDLIYIFAGEYTMGNVGSGEDYEVANNGFNSDNTFLRDSVNYYADNGAVIWNKTSFESYMLYDTVGYRINFYGDVTLKANTSTLILRVNEPDGNETAHYDIRGQKVEYGDGGSNQQVIDVRRAKYFNWDFKELETYGTRLFTYGSATDADTTENMSLFINHDYIDTRQGGSNIFVKNGGTLDSSRIAFTFGIWEGTGAGDAMGLFERAVTNCTYTIQGQFNATGYSKLLGGSRGDFHNNNILVDLVYRSNTELFNEFYKDQLQTNTAIVTDRSTLKITGSYHYTGSGSFLRFGGNSTPPGLDLIVDANVMSYNSQVMEFQSGNTRVSANIVGGMYETDAAGQPVIKISTNQQSGNPGTDNGGIFITNARFKNQNDTAVIISTVANQKVNVGGLYTFGNDLTKTPQEVTYLPMQEVGAAGGSSIDTFYLQDGEYNILVTSDGETDTLIAPLDVITGAYCYFDRRNGNDTTGVRGSINKPFRTWWAAYEAAENGDIIEGLARDTFITEGLPRFSSSDFALTVDDGEVYVYFFGGSSSKDVTFNFFPGTVISASVFDFDIDVSNFRWNGGILKYNGNPFDDFIVNVQGDGGLTEIYFEKIDSFVDPSFTLAGGSFDFKIDSLINAEKVNPQITFNIERTFQNPTGEYEYNIDIPYLDSFMYITAGIITGDMDINIGGGVADVLLETYGGSTDANLKVNFNVSSGAVTVGDWDGGLVDINVFNTGLRVPNGNLFQNYETAFYFYNIPKETTIKWKLNGLLIDHNLIAFEDYANAEVIGNNVKKVSYLNTDFDAFILTSGLSGTTKIIGNNFDISNILLNDFQLDSTYIFNNSIFWSDLDDYQYLMEVSGTFLSILNNVFLYNGTASNRSILGSTTTTEFTYGGNSSNTPLFSDLFGYDSGFTEWGPIDLEQAIKYRPVLFEASDNNNPGSFMSYKIVGVDTFSVTSQTDMLLRTLNGGDITIETTFGGEVLVNGDDAVRVTSGGVLSLSSSGSQANTSTNGNITYTASNGYTGLLGEDARLATDSLNAVGTPATTILGREPTLGLIRTVGGTELVYVDTLSFDADTNPAASVFTPNRRVDVSVNATGTDAVQFGLPTPGPALDNVEIHCFVFDDSSGDCSINSGASTLLDPTGTLTTTYTFPGSGLWIVRCRYSSVLNTWYWVMTR